MIRLFSSKTAVSRLVLASFCTAAVTACATIAPETEPAIVEAPAVVEETVAVEAAPDAPMETPTLAFTEAGIAELEQTMAQYVEEGRLYGIHTRLTHKGAIVSDFKTGLRGLENQTPIEDDTIYRIYSMTKPVTGVAMMMLWEEGKFDLDDPITKHIPEFESLKVLGGVNEDGSAILVDMERAPTIREVMSHTSGFAYGLGGADPANSAFRDLKVLESPDLQTFIDRTATIPLLFQPGEHWFYSVGMDIQGYLIEKWSGQTFGEFLQTRMFEPLGMVDTGFYVPEEEYDRLSEVYGFDPETGALVPIPFPGVMFKKETINFESGGGGLVSTMDDYGRFAEMLVRGGTLDGVQIIKPETLEIMTTNVMPEGAVMSDAGMNLGEQFPGIGMGLTVGTIEDSASVPTKIADGSYFWGGAASTWFWIDPVNELHFVGMVQIFSQNNPNGPLELREVSSDAVYSAIAK